MLYVIDLDLNETIHYKAYDSGKYSECYDDCRRESSLNFLFLTSFHHVARS